MPRRPARILTRILVGVLVAGCAVGPPEPAGPPGGRSGGLSDGRSVGPGVDDGSVPATSDGYARALAAHTNTEREGLGLAPLAPSTCARRAARARAAALVGGPLEHAPLSGVSRACAPGGRVAENIVRSGEPPAAVVAAWMGSPGHRNNIVDPRLTELGVGCVPDGDDYLCAQIFLDLRD